MQYLGQTLRMNPRPPSVWFLTPVQAFLMELSERRDQLDRRPAFYSAYFHIRSMINLLAWAKHLA